MKAVTGTKILKDGSLGKTKKSFNSQAEAAMYVAKQTKTTTPVSTIATGINKNVRGECKSAYGYSWSEC